MRFSEVIEGCSVERVLRVVEGRCVKVQSMLIIYILTFYRMSAFGLSKSRVSHEISVVAKSN